MSNPVQSTVSRGHEGLPASSGVSSATDALRVLANALLRAAGFGALAWIVWLKGSDLLALRASSGDSAWDFGLVGWLELAGVDDGALLNTLFALSVISVIGYRLWRIVRTPADEADAASPSRNPARPPGASEAPAAKTLEQLAAEEAAAGPWLVAWWLFALGCALFTLASGLGIALLLLYGAWRIWRIFADTSRREVWSRAGSRQSAAGTSDGSSDLLADGSAVASTEVPGSTPGKRKDGALAGNETKLWALLLLPAKFVLGMFKGLRVLLRYLLVPRLYRALERFLLALLLLAPRGILIALKQVRNPRSLARVTARDALIALALWCMAFMLSLLVGYSSTEAEAYSQASPTVSSLLLRQVSAAELPAAATAALEKAAATGNMRSVRAIYESGMIDGTFHLRGYQEARRGRGMCRDALPRAWSGIQLEFEKKYDPETMAELGITLIRFALDEKFDRQTLVREARCANSAKNLPLILFQDALKRQTDFKLDAHMAVESGNAELLAYALANGAELEAVDWQGRTPLLAALELLALAEQRHFRLAAVGVGNQALDAEAEVQRYQRIVGELLARGASADAVDRGRRSAAFLAVQTGLQADTLKSLLARVQVESTTALGATLLHAAAASGRVELVKELVRKGVPVRNLTSDGRSAMHFARGAEMVWQLLDLGLDAELADARGRTPFHHAVIRGDISAARSLGGLSRDRNARDHFGYAAFDYAPVEPKQAGVVSAPGKKKVQAKPEWRHWLDLAGEFPEGRTGFFKEWR